MVNTWKISFKATLHCLVGCAMGEVLGMVIGTYLGFSNFATILLAIILAFIFGYALSLLTLLKHLSFKKALTTAFVADTASILVMELIDNLVLLMIPGALHAHIDEPFFWISLAIALFVAFWVALPVNYFLIKRGKGHALAHSHH
jgi:hypothetical protein